MSLCIPNNKEVLNLLLFTLYHIHGIIPVVIHAETRVPQLDRYDWENGSCYCNACSRPPCGWCESTGVAPCHTCGGEVFVHRDYEESEDGPVYCEDCTKKESIYRYSQDLWTQKANLEYALKSLHNKDLQEAIMREYDNTPASKNITEFITDLLSPAMAEKVLQVFEAQEPLTYNPCGEIKL